MAKLSVNINKIALIRNARGGNFPDLIQIAKDCEKYGAQGITVHPRPDERHIRYQDVFDLKPILKTEFNIEGNPTKKFLDVVLSTKPDQVTLVPDAPEALTSSAGWDTKKNLSFLTEIIETLQEAGIRTSIFLDPIPEMVEYAARTGTDRIELYTESYAKGFFLNKENAIKPFVDAAKQANDAGLKVNAGHDLNLDNLRYFNDKIDKLMEVSIGHALIADAIYFGLEKTIKLYLEKLS